MLFLHFLFLDKMVCSIDPAWTYGVPVNVKRTKIQYNYFHKEVNGGITSLKQHLAHKAGKVAKCPNVPQEVRREMKALLPARKKKKKKK